MRPEDVRRSGEAGAEAANRQDAGQSVGRAAADEEVVAAQAAQVAHRRGLQEQQGAWCLAELPVWQQQALAPGQKGEPGASRLVPQERRGAVRLAELPVRQQGSAQARPQEPKV